MNVTPLPGCCFGAVQIALDHVEFILKENPSSTMWVEERVDPPLPSDEGEGAGYCDVVILTPPPHTLYVLDYKHGQGVVKEAVGNRQLLQYAAGFLYGQPQRVDPSQVEEVVLCIMQPRGFHEDAFIREWRTSPKEVEVYLAALDNAVAAGLKDDAPLVPGPDQCRFCPARTVCPAREEDVVRTIRDDLSQVQQLKDTPQVSAMDVQRMAHIFAKKGQIKKFLDDVETHLWMLARHGHTIPGHKLVEAKGKRRYVGDGTDTAIKLVSALWR